LNSAKHTPHLAIKYGYSDSNNVFRGREGGIFKKIQIKMMYYWELGRSRFDVPVR